MVLLVATFLVPVGCGPGEVDTTYGRSRGRSINGTGAFVELLRGRGHEVRPAARATATLAQWANVVIRFAGQPGPPDVKEGKWLLDWLLGSPGRKVVYVPRDYDAGLEFWGAMLAAEPKDANPEEVARIERKRDLAGGWVGELPPRSKQPARPADWFAVEPKPSAPSTCRKLEGPWASGVDVAEAALPRHEGLKFEGDETVLLSGDGSPLVVTWNLENGSQVLVVANASFLLNASLLNHARRPLTMRVVGWVGDTPLHVASFERPGWPVEGGAGEDDSPSRLFRIFPFSWVFAHFLAFLLLLALAHAARAGRPSPEPPSGVERPSAHPEALGVLLARTGRADAARHLIETYRRWRHPSHAAGPPAQAPPSSRRVPRS